MRVDTITSRRTEALSDSLRISEYRSGVVRSGRVSEVEGKRRGVCEEERYQRDTEGEMYDGSV